MNAEHVSEEELEGLAEDARTLVRLFARLGNYVRAKAARSGGDATKANEFAEEIDKCFKDAEKSYKMLRSLLVDSYAFSDCSLDVA